jgi:hypothetical protein
VFRETNIIGELESGTYERGRFAVNLFAPGSKIEKPVGELQQQVWAQIDRLERQLRIGAAYDVSQDAISPNSFATGNAIRELGGSVTLNVQEYHMVLRHAIERIDSKRLEWAEAMWPNRRSKIYSFGGKPSAGFYRPRTDIKGEHETRRIYGAMATWDDGQKAVVGLQYLQAGVLDVETIQENVDGLGDLNLINQRNRARKAEETLLARLAQRTEQDPTADVALIEIMDNPADTHNILKKYFTPQEPEMSPEEQQFMAQAQAQAQGQGPPGGPGEVPPAVTSVLSQVEASGETGGGVQTVGTLRR